MNEIYKPQTIENPKLIPNVEEYLDIHGISNVTFVFAHPDDLDGYAGGLFSSLVELQKVRSELGIKLIVVTDGANGTKEGIDRNQLKMRREQEQLDSLEHLGMQNAHNHVTFLEQTDGDVNEIDLENNLEEQLNPIEGHLIITHDSRSWGSPGNRGEADNEYFVQNHPDHRAIAKTLERMVKQGKLPATKLLEATWNHEESNLTAEYPEGLKKGAFTMHLSQYQQNQGSMDAIVDTLNHYGHQTDRVEFFREVDVSEEVRSDVSKSSLLALAGLVLNSPNEIRSLEEMRDKHQIQSSVSIGNSAIGIFEKDTRIDLTENPNLHDALILAVRGALADIIILDDETATPDILKIVDKVMMFDASTYSPTIDLAGRAIRMLLIPDDNGNVEHMGKRYQFIKGVW